MKLSLETLLESISDKNLWVKFLKLAKNYTEYDSRNSRKVRNNLKKHSIIKVTGGVLNKEVLFFTITLDNGREYLVVKDFVNYFGKPKKVELLFPYDLVSFRATLSNVDIVTFTKAHI